MPMCKFAPAILALVVAMGGVPAARREPWPQRPVRIIVPFGAGGSSDVAARILAQQLGAAFGQQVLVENRPVASGVLAAEAVAHAAADGYTLLICDWWR
jgi:tripartite-type tricarboxylate transporter receptor subunit TctC